MELKGKVIGNAQNKYVYDKLDSFGRLSNKTGHCDIKDDNRTCSLVTRNSDHVQSSLTNFLNPEAFDASVVYEEFVCSPRFL